MDNIKEEFPFEGRTYHLQSRSHPDPIEEDHFQELFEFGKRCLESWGRWAALDEMDGRARLMKYRHQALIRARLAIEALAYQKEVERGKRG